jgi:hypothetical protein
MPFPGGGGVEDGRDALYLVAGKRTDEERLGPGFDGEILLS